MGIISNLLPLYVGRKICKWAIIFHCNVCEKRWDCLRSALCVQTCTVCRNLCECVNLQVRWARTRRCCLGTRWPSHTGWEWRRSGTAHLHAHTGSSESSWRAGETKRKREGVIDSFFFITENINEKETELLPNGEANEKAAEKGRKTIKPGVTEMNPPLNCKHSVTIQVGRGKKRRIAVVVTQIKTWCNNRRKGRERWGLNVSQETLVPPPAHFSPQNIWEEWQPAVCFTWLTSTSTWRSQSQLYDIALRHHVQHVAYMHAS